MDTKRFREVFGQYVDLNLIPDSCINAGVQSIEINQSRRAVTIRLAFSVFVDFGVIQAAERVISDSLKINAAIEPSYPPHTLKDGCFPTIMEFLKRRVAAINGTFDGAGCRIENDLMTITLTHGGLNIIKATKTDKILVQLVHSLFGRAIQLQFDGVTDIGTVSEQYRSLMEEAEKEAAFKAFWALLLHPAAAFSPEL
ncbi:MAG TPA: hypothetical protein PLG48_05560, partial [Candidatus Avimonas sp.]|nr:hypothetical protein [Candidatus Avimonas sp.]